MSFKFGITHKTEKTSTPTPPASPRATSGPPSVSITGALTITNLPPHQQASQPTHYDVEARERLKQEGVMLREAVENGDRKAIERLLKKGVDPNWIYDCSEFKLNKIVKNISLLKKHGLDLSRGNKIHETLLENACKKRDFSCAKKLIENGADINQKDSVGNTVLHYACAAGDAELVQQLVALGANVQIDNKHFNSPTVAAFTSQLPPEQLRAVLRALSKGEDDSNWRVMGRAGQFGHWDALAWGFAENWVPCQDYLHLVGPPQNSKEILEGIDACFIEAIDQKDDAIMANCIVSLAGFVGASGLPREREALQNQVGAIYAKWQAALPGNTSTRIILLFDAAQQKLSDPERYDARAYFRELGLI